MLSGYVTFERLIIDVRMSLESEEYTSKIATWQDDRTKHRKRFDSIYENLIKSQISRLPGAPRAQKRHVWISYCFASLARKNITAIGGIEDCRCESTDN